VCSSPFKNAGVGVGPRHHLEQLSLFEGGVGEGAGCR